MSLPPPPPVLRGPAPGWYPVDGDRIGWWDGSRWAYIPPPPPRRTPYGDDERDVPVTRSWWGIVAGFAVAIGLTLVVALVLDDVDSQSNLWLVVGVVPIWIGLLTGCVVASNRSGVSLVDSWGLPQTRRGWVRAIAIGVGMGIAIRVASGIAAAPFLPLLDDQEDFPFGQVAPLVDADSGLLWMFGFIAIVGAPLFEEAFFRGVVQGTLLGRLSVPLALGIQGVVFGAVHLSLDNTAVLNMLTMAAITVAGIGFGWLTWWSRTLVTAVVGHATFNAIAVAFVVALPWLEEVVRST